MNWHSFSRPVAYTIVPVLLACALAAATSALPTGASAASPMAHTPCPVDSDTGQTTCTFPVPASAAAVRQAVAAGASITKVPANVEPTLENAAKDDGHFYSQDCAEATKVGDATFGECVYGAPTAKKTFVLLGDSHAAMWFDGLKEAATLGGWKMRIFTMSGCPAVQLTFYGPEGGSACNAWRAKAIAAIRKLKPNMVVVTSASFQQGVAKNTFASAAQWQAGMTATLNKLKAPNTKLVILGDIPVLQQSAPDCLAAHESAVQSCATPRAQALNGVLHGAEIAAAKATGARRIDVTNWLCAATCPPIINNILVYRNQFHISRTYSLYLAGVLRAAVLR